MANAFEIIGQKEMALADANAEYSKLWNILKSVKEGLLPIEDVTLFQDGAGRCSWKIVSEPAVERCGDVSEFAPDAGSALSALKPDGE